MESPDAHHGYSNVPVADVGAQGQKPALLSSSSHFLHTITLSLVLSLKRSQPKPLCINHSTFLLPDPSLSHSLTPACQCFIRRDILLSVSVTSLIASPSNQLSPNEFYWQSLNVHKQLCATSRGCKADLWEVKSNGNHSLHHILSPCCPGASVVVSRIYRKPQSVEFTMSSEQEIWHC